MYMKKPSTVGFGTYPLKGETCFKAILDAAEVGYRIIDTATFYENFVPIGQAVKKLGRESFYLISKVWPNAHTPKLLKKDLAFTLKQLQTSYLDAYLLHWPNSALPIAGTLQALNDLKTEGLIHDLGLSNVTVHHLKRVLELKTAIGWVQVEMHPLFYDPVLLKFCQEHDITIQAWAPLGRGRLNQDPMLRQIGEKHNKTAAQIALQWILQHGCIPLPGSQNKHHMRENLNVGNFLLSSEEMEKIDQRAKMGQRERVPLSRGLGFTDEFDFPYEKCWPKQ